LLREFRVRAGEFNDGATACRGVAPREGDDDDDDKDARDGDADGTDERGDQLT
jgi:hypothetical protein